ncbi:hypothetical protein COCSADRAFT_353794 [Bipolaris sorokiniana ND90Pr]|uniref:Lysine-specific metallo-endopeptidase domain-containing protein n=1 Tax=Cochliobolus sativus (strain ND90Pr / ATCC 201652) TaxID=665912 RepID=M2RID0_COCSN|nr:uncharacterized protein COCSADRAFT_353794 [Bipolaris sorokiniana ND90Pr]EMD66494.1 hypothetical protein COCSADRAFT_353794 [Bipolaris sorokiniana ND90Pr]
MTFLKAFSFALALASAVHAKPISNSPTRVVARQAPPEPSSYPLGDACTNEWRYLNFDPDNETDKAHLELLHNILCSGEMLAITSYGAGAAERALKPYLRHFGLNEEQDDPAERPDEYHFQNHVKNVLNLLAGDGENNVKLGAVVGSFVVDNKDFGADIPNASNCDGRTYAYTLVDEPVDQQEKIHFCDITWTGRLESIADIDCGALDPYPSVKMDSISRIILHEWTHYSSVGPKTSLEDKIQDRLNDDGVSAYEPDRTHGLIDPEQDDDPVGASLNADNYAWMALDAYVSRICATDPSGDNWQTFFTENPPDYEREDDSDPETPPSSRA